MEPQEHEEYWSDPESVPSLQVRDCETHDWPRPTVALWYAVTDEPCATVWPLKVQLAGGPTVQETWGKEPVRLPSLHVRVWETHVEP